MRLTHRILLGSLAIVFVLAALVVTVADRRLTARLTANAVQTLTREAQLIAAQWTPDLSPDSLANAAGGHLVRRVTLIDTAGRVVGDSDFDPPALQQLEDHAGRPEVIAARTTGAGWSQRSSPSAGDEELYVAVRAPLGVARLSMHTRALADITSGAQRDVWVAAGVAMLVALVLTLLFARGVSRPIIALRDVARSLAAGDLSRRPALSVTGEVGDLADALVRMAEQLGARLGALESDDALMTALIESLNEGVVATNADGQVVRVNESARTLLSTRAPTPFPITQLPRDRVFRETLSAALAGGSPPPLETVVAGHTLAVTARSLASSGGGAVLTLFDLTPFKKMDAVRRDFVANVSHELRTPLTVVHGFADTLAGDDTLPETQQRFAQAIRANTVRMERLVDDLLDLSRIESGGWVPEPELVRIAPVAAEVMDALRTDAERRGLKLTVDVEASPTVFADRTALRQVLMNLVSNSVRHTTTGGVAISTRAARDGVAVSVADTGSGVPPDQLPRIFERFYRVDPARSRSDGGTGLGLAIVRHLVESHGGTVSAESAPGVGTTVTAVFPAH